MWKLPPRSISGSTCPERKNPMKKKLLVLGFALLLTAVWASLASASELTLGGGVAYQLGNYAFTISENDVEEPYKCSASAAPLRYELGVGYGAWSLTGFLSTRDLGKGEVDDRLSQPDEDVVDYGGMTAFGADISYLFDLGSLKIGPSVGYRSTRVVAGVKRLDEAASVAQGRGLQTRGFRLGAEASAVLRDRFAFAASLGCSPRVAVVEVEELTFHNNADHVSGDYDIYNAVPEPDKAFAFDLAVTASVRVIPAVEIVGGYRYGSTCIELDPEASFINAYAYSVKESVFHVGARCRF